MIRLRDIHKEYPNGTKALKGVSMQIDDGDFVFLVGPSGSGKSTIIKLITAEIAPTKGKLMVNGYNLNDISEKQIPLLRRTIGVVFQDFRLIEKKTVFENIEVAMRAVGATTSEIRRRIPYVLGLVGLTGKSRQLPTQLSGGEQQRVAIARALANNPRHHRRRADGQLGPGPVFGDHVATGKDQRHGHHHPGGYPRARAGQPLRQARGGHRERPHHQRRGRGVLRQWEIDRSGIISGRASGVSLPMG